MAYLNQDTNELHLKILYVGGCGCGKTTNLQSIFKQTSSEIATRFFDLHSLSINSSHFEFLPVSYGEIRAHALRLHLYTLPTNNLWNSLLLNLFYGVDGIVHVIDSRIALLQDNEQQFNRVKSLLKMIGKNYTEIPYVFQYNHRDSPYSLPVTALRSEYSRSHMSAVIEAVAVQDIGVMETLNAVAERILLGMEYVPSEAQREHLGL